MLRDGSDGARERGNASAGASDGADDVSARAGDGADGESMLLRLRRLSGAELGLLSRGELTAVLEGIERLVNRLAGYRAEVLGALDGLSRSGAAPDAAPHQTLRDAAGISDRDARRLVRAAAKAREHPQVLEALSGGDINPAQAEAISDARVPDRVRAGLVDAAGTEDTDATRRRVRQAEADHCNESTAERFERQRADRCAGWGREHNGMFKLWARFDPETGARVEATLEQLRRAYWQHDKSQSRGRRTPAQRDADALAFALAGVALTDADARVIDNLLAPAAGRGDAATLGVVGNPDSDEPCSGPQLPPAQISVLIGLDALRGQTDEAGITDAGTELAPETVRRLACDAEIIPMCLGGPGGPADIGRVRRAVPLRLRRLLIARDRHCQWPGCDAPSSRCDAHHIIHWAAKGPTNLDNLLLLCHAHHQQLHEHGYELEARPDGGWVPIRPPDQRRSAAPRQPRAP